MIRNGILSRPFSSEPRAPARLQSLRGAQEAFTVALH
jgi:hypothetical protein